MIYYVVAYRLPGQTKNRYITDHYRSAPKLYVYQKTADGAAKRLKEQNLMLTYVEVLGVDFFMLQWDMEESGRETPMFRPDV